MPEPEAHGLMPKDNPWGHHDHVSRDYADIDCKAYGCMFNQEGKCGVPSVCKINNHGQCEGFRARPMPDKIDGD